MTSNQPFALVYEVERTLYESSSTWEGIDAQEIPLSKGEVVLRIQPGFAAAMPLRFHPAAVETSLAHAIEQVEAIVPWCLWVIGPSSQPSDLQQRFVALGFTVRMEWEGLTCAPSANSNICSYFNQAWIQASLSLCWPRVETPCVHNEQLTS